MTPPPAGVRRVRMTGPERREQLINVGRGVFAQRGYEAASVEEIAERAGVSKPVVYEHFAGKDRLYKVVVDREVAVLLERIAAALQTDGHPRAAVTNATEAFLSYIEDHHDGFQILVRDAPVGTSEGTLPSLLDDIAAKAQSLLAGHFDERGYDVSLAALYARALVGMVAVTGQWWLQAGEPSRQEVAAHLVNLAWNGLSHLQKAPQVR